MLRKPNPASWRSPVSEAGASTLYRRFELTMPISITVKKGPDVSAAFNDLLTRDVVVGIPSGSARTPVQGSKTPVDNATLGYIHEFGSPEANIPERPFLIPGIEAVKDQIAAKLKDAIPKAIAGDRRAVQQALDSVGLIAQTAVRKRILSGPFQPLSEATLRARARRLTSAGKLSKSATAVQAREELASRAAGADPSSVNARPLYDTHSLFNSVTYIVRGKGPHHD